MQSRPKASLLKYVLCLLLLSGIANGQDFYPCTRVIDGDTIIVDMNGKQERAGAEAPALKEQLSSVFPRLEPDRNVLEKQVGF